MTTIYWQSFERMDALRRQINEVFGDLARTAIEPQDTGWWPRIALVDTPDYFRLQMQLPGIDRDSLDIQATSETVSISGECSYAERGDRAFHLPSDCAYGQFSRIIQLPVQIDPETIQANLHEGLLTLILIKAERPRHLIESAPEAVVVNGVEPMLLPTQKI